MTAVRVYLEQGSHSHEVEPVTDQLVAVLALHVIVEVAARPVLRCLCGGAEYEPHGDPHTLHAEHLAGVIRDLPAPHFRIPCLRCGRRPGTARWWRGTNNLDERMQALVMPLCKVVTKP